MSGVLTLMDCTLADVNSHCAAAQPWHSTCDHARFACVRVYITHVPHAFAPPVRLCCRAASRWHIDSVITGQTKVNQMDEYLDALAIKLDEETFEEIEKIYRSNRNPQWTD